MTFRKQDGKPSIRERLLSILTTTPAKVADLATQLNAATSAVSSGLYVMQERGVARKVEGGWILGAKTAAPKLPVDRILQAANKQPQTLTVTLTMTRKQLAAAISSGTISLATITMEVRS